MEEGASYMLLNDGVYELPRLILRKKLKLIAKETAGTVVFARTKVFSEEHGR